MDFVEQVARIMYEEGRAEHGDVGPWEETSQWFRLDYTIQARQAISAIVAAGCKVVRREPTDGMIDAGVNKWSVAGAENGTRKTFRSMFDAAPAWPGADDDTKA